MAEQKLIDQKSSDASAHYEPYGWQHWPEHPWLSYQFRRALGESQEGGGSVSESFLAASRMRPGDKESWHKEWLVIAQANLERGYEAEAKGHTYTARRYWLKACNQFRSAEFWLPAHDERRLATFLKCEESFQAAGRYFDPPIEKIEVPYLDGQVLHGYFIQSPGARAAGGKQPVLIGFGGLDSFKEELYFMVGRGALERGISCLLMDGAGQGATLRKHGIHNRFDYEVPVGACIDYLLARGDVDAKRIAVSGSSLGGYYAARAAAFEPRLAAAVSHGAVWAVNEIWGEADETHGLAEHIKWVFGAGSMREALQMGEAFTLEGVVERIRCPYLIVHGGFDVLGVRQAQHTFDAAKKGGVDVTLRLIEEDETGAEHCQHDNPTLAQDIIGDWLADRFDIKQPSR
ncbi:alpha/beta hydrolase family protein [Pusillimonas sp.]|uniref:alpha/beta hydrolase family protein n=1 Tax=Pusillimonas sp. TaxID=3040095 RepID=UPI0037C92D28